jgi:tetratricopeptide (TPR) repeat protein
MKKKIIKYLSLALLVLVSVAVGFGLSEYLRIKRRPQMSAMAELSGTCAYEDKDVSTALQSLYVAIFLNPANGGAHHSLAYVLYDQGLYDLSLDEFKKYLQNPESGFFTEFSDKNKKDKIQEKFGKHDIAWTYCYIADIYEKKGDKENSLKNYRKAIESDPDFKKFLDVYTKVINDKKEKKDRDFKKLEQINKTLSRINEAEKGT